MPNQLKPISQDSPISPTPIGAAPDYQSAYSTWAADPSPGNASTLLTHLDPIIGSSINRYAGKDDPLIRGRARRMAMDAIRTYDPKRGVRLTTHVTNHLMGLRRASRQQSQFLRVPERASMEQAYLQRMEAELTEDLGREPSAIELADHSGLPVHKIARLRRYVPGAIESSLPEDIGTSNRFDPQDRELRIAEILHHELPPRDQKILEWSIGLHGSPKISNQEIASKLNVTPGAISQRKAILQKKLDTMVGFLE
jgi:DNA-directed RNA polymerase specialized sigma subunit